MPAGSGLTLTLSSGSASVTLPSGTAAAGTRLREVSWPAPAPAPTLVSSADVDGDDAVSVRYANRTVTITVRAAGATELAVRNLLGAWDVVVGQVKERLGGTLVATWDNGDQITFDVVTAQSGVAVTRELLRGVVGESTITLQAKPLARGAQYNALTATAVNATHFVQTITAPAGDAPALGKLTVTPASASLRTIFWGVESQSSISTAATNGVWFPVGSTPGVNLTAAGGGVLQSSTGAYSGQAIVGSVSGDGTGRGVAIATIGTDAVPVTHAAPVRVIARVQVNNTTCTLGLSWGAPFGARVVNAAQAGVGQAGYALVDLGVVDPSQLKSGWVGVIGLIQGAAYLDGCWLVPAQTTGSARTAILDGTTGPMGVTAYDYLTSTAAALGGRVAQTGGTWTTSGDATDFATSSSLGATRATTAVGSAQGRVALLGSGTAKNWAVRAEVQPGVNTTTGVIVATTATAYMAATFTQASAGAPYGVELWTYTAGARASLATATTAITSGRASIELRTYDSGRWAVWVGPVGSGLYKIASGWSASLAPQGSLRNGLVGIVDVVSATTSSTRSLSNFAAWPLIADEPAPLGSSLQVDQASHLRVSSGGAGAMIGGYSGDHAVLRQGPGSSRLVVKTSRDLDVIGWDSAVLDTFGVRLDVTPRYLSVPHQ